MRGGKAVIFEAKNSRAVSLLKSWLRAVQIGFRVGEGAVDLLITAKDGSIVSVQVDADELLKAPEGCTVVKAATFTGRHIQAAMDAFSALQVQLGYEPKLPVDRGEIPTQKLSYVDSFEDVALRHTEFRRAPNPSNEDLAKYEPVMKKACWNFVRTNSALLQDHMIEFNELFGTYARCYTITYLAWYLVPEHKISDANNERKLYAYLWQRFGELRSLLQKKGRSTLVSADVASIGRDGKAYDAGSCVETWEGSTGFRFPSRSVVQDVADSEEDVDVDYIKRHKELDTRNPNARRVSARKLLEVKLAKLDHNSMVELLQDAAENIRIHPDAQREAASRLAKHISECSSCIHLAAQYGSAPVDEDEELAAVDSLRAAE